MLNMQFPGAIDRNRRRKVIDQIVSNFQEVESLRVFNCSGKNEDDSLYQLLRRQNNNYAIDKSNNYTDLCQIMLPCGPINVQIIFFTDKKKR